MSTLIDEFFTTGPDGATLSGTSQSGPNCAFTTIVGAPFFEGDLPDALVGDSDFAMRVTTSSAAAYAREDLTAIAQGAERIYFYLPDGPPAADTFIDALLFDTSARAQIRLNAAGTMAVRNGASVPTGGTTTNSALAADTLYRAERIFDNGAGTQRLVIYPGHSTSPLSGGDTGNVTYNQGTVNNARVGVTAAGTLDIVICAYRLDDTAALIGPAVPTTVTVNAEAAAGTGAAGDITPSTRIGAVEAVGVGSAPFDFSTNTLDLTLISDAPIEAAGAAYPATFLLGATAPAAEGTGAAPDPTVAIAGPTLAEAAEATGDVPDAVLLLLLFGEAAEGIGAALDATVSIPTALYRFVSPTRTVKDHPFAGMGPGRGMAVDRVIGLTVLRVDGVWRVEPATSAAEEAAADRVYHGGHVHTVDQAEADELVAAGFGAYLTALY